MKQFEFLLKVWKFKETYFRRNLEKEDSWEELQNGSVVYRFFQISSNTTDKIVLKSIERKNMFVELSNTTAKWGSKVEDIPNTFLYGSWIDGKFFEKR